VSADPSEAVAEGPDPSVTDDAYLEWCSPRFGKTNPERLNNPLWEWLIRSGWSAYAVRHRFDPTNEKCSAPGWCFSRFGQSSTPLADGRTILIAGEHEDAYDSDFYIYNDVVVRGAGGDIDIYGYPKDVFPPTDFHSATLAGDRIVVIGSLGYPAERKLGTTAVAFVDLDTFAVSRVASSEPAPGWIHRHDARLSDDGRAIVVSGGKIVRGELHSQEFIENADDWRLDLASWRWERITDRRWTQFHVSRADRRPNRLWQMNSLWTLRGGRWAAEHRESMEAMIRGQVEQLTAEYGVAPDVELFGLLYRPPIAHEQLPDIEDEFGVRRIRVDGTVIRYIEQPHGIQMIVEGALPPPLVDALVADLRDMLARVEHTDYFVRKL
jgi:hypothetical protein